MSEIASPDSEPERIDLGDDSFVEIRRGWWMGANRWARERAPGLDWAQGEVLRYDRYRAEQRLGTRLDARNDPDMAPLTRWLDARYRVRFDGVTALWYRTGDDFQGLHRDRQLRWLDETLIAIVVIGRPRPFVLRPITQAREPRLSAGHGPQDRVVDLGGGDLIVMGGACQREWLHGIPKVKGHTAARYSLTWRWTSRRGCPDTAPTYFDGRRFSDDHERPGWRARRA